MSENDFFMGLSLDANLKNFNYGLNESISSYEASMAGLAKMFAPPTINMSDFTYMTTGLDAYNSQMTSLAKMFTSTRINLPDLTYMTTGFDAYNSQVTRMAEMFSTPTVNQGLLDSIGLACKGLSEPTINQGLLDSLSLMGEKMNEQTAQMAQLAGMFTSPMVNMPDYSSLISESVNMYNSQIPSISEMLSGQTVNQSLLDSVSLACERLSTHRTDLKNEDKISNFKSLDLTEGSVLPQEKQKKLGRKRVKKSSHLKQGMAVKTGGSGEICGFERSYEVDGKKITIRTKHSYKLLIQFYETLFEQNFN